MTHELTNQIRKAESVEKVAQLYKEATDLMHKGEITEGDFKHIGKVKDNAMKKIAERGKTGGLAD